MAWHVLESRVLIEPVVAEDLFDFMLWKELQVEDKRALEGTGGGIIVTWCVAEKGEDDCMICPFIAAATVFLGLTRYKSKFEAK